MEEADRSTARAAPTRDSGPMNATTSTVTTYPAYFTAAGTDTFEPTPSAAGYWGEGLLSGPAVAGLAAHALEERYGDPEFQPARFTIDLLKPARQAPIRVQTRVIRDGRRARYTECDVLQGDWIVAQAGLVQYRRSAAPAGTGWTSTAEFTPPAHAGGDGMFVGSDQADWSPMGEQHQNTSRKRAYYRGLEVIDGTAATAFVRAVIVAEAATNLVAHLGTAGIGYINGDLTVALSRLPISEFIGVQADSQFAADGVSVGNATMFDDAGPFGTAMVTSLANPAAQIDFAAGTTVSAPGSELFSDTGVPAP